MSGWEEGGEIQVELFERGGLLGFEEWDGMGLDLRFVYL